MRRRFAPRVVVAQGGVWIWCEETTRRRLSHELAAIFQDFIDGVFVVAGANHFRTPAVYLGMMPFWLPSPLALIYISGAAEILGGIGLCVPLARKFSGWGLIALLIAVFPANLHVALQGHMPGFDFSPLILWLRLPFQIVAIGWVWWTILAPARNETLD